VSDASFFEELKRRNVYKVGIAYAIASWLLLQVIDVVVHPKKTGPRERGPAAYSLLLRSSS
jgi:hypothetical protein